EDRRFCTFFWAVQGARAPPRPRRGGPRAWRGGKKDQNGGETPHPQSGRDLPIREKPRLPLGRGGARALGGVGLPPAGGFRPQNMTGPAGVSALTARRPRARGERRRERATGGSDRGLLVRDSVPRRAGGRLAAAAADGGAVHHQAAGAAVLEHAAQAVAA